MMMMPRRRAVMMPRRKAYHRHQPTPQYNTAILTEAAASGNIVEKACE